MATTVDDLLEQAKDLSEDDRLVLGEALLATVPPEPGYEDAWSREILRRVEDLESGRVKGIPAEEVFRELRKRFR